MVFECPFGIFLPFFLVYDLADIINTMYYVLNTLDNKCLNNKSSLNNHRLKKTQRNMRFLEKEGEIKNVKTIEI